MITLFTVVQRRKIDHPEIVTVVTLKCEDYFYGVKVKVKSDFEISLDDIKQYFINKISCVFTK